MRLRLVSGIGLGLVLALSVFLAAAHTSQTTIQEFAMTPGGDLGEINPDGQGNLWVSEYGANNIWQINPTANTYNRYSGLTGGVVEAQVAPDGQVWYGGYDSALLGRINLGTSTVTTWTLPGAVHPWGLAIEPNGALWIAEHDVARFYRYSPGSNQFCTYALPNDSKGVGLLAADNAIWFMDYINDGIVRIDSASNQMKTWPILSKDNANAQSLVYDGAGNLWWGDNGMGALARLEISTNRISLYTSDGVSSPSYIGLMGSKVWFVDTFFNQFGLVDTATAVHHSYAVTPTTAALTPTCAGLGAGNSSPVVTSPGVVNYTNVTVPDPQRRSCGWITQGVPEKGNTYDAHYANGRFWTSDFGRDRLIATPDQWSGQIGICHLRFLPAITRN